MKVNDWKKTYWEDEKGNRTSVEEVLSVLQDEPTLEIRLSDLSHIPSTCIEEHRRLTADLSFPIMVIEEDGEYKSILDGHHRRQKAIDEKRTYILGKVFNWDIVNDRINVKKARPNILNELTKWVNHLDSVGLKLEADVLDGLLKEAAKNE